VVLKLKENENRAIREFSGNLKEKYGSQVEFIRLYGSKARGDDDRFSDIDLFILVKEKNEELRQFVLDTAFEANLKYGVLLSTIIYDKKSFSSPIAQVTPFIRSVINEGVPT
jgi:predicted nucleotidyltransferase